MTPDLPGDDCGAQVCYSDDHSGERAGAGTDELGAFLDSAGGGARHRQRTAYALGERPELLCGIARVSRPSGVFQS